MSQRVVKVGQHALGNDQPVVLIAGLNVLESYELAETVASALRQVCQKLSIPWVFK
ncbi:MAG: 3-deoxy-8-phosphooctulonate synthase, partial [Gammaproteobacteria bacterium]